MDLAKVSHACQTCQTSPQTSALELCQLVIFISRLALTSHARYTEGAPWPMQIADLSLPVAAMRACYGHAATRRLPGVC